MRPNLCWLAVGAIVLGGMTACDAAGPEDPEATGGAADESAGDPLLLSCTAVHAFVSGGAEFRIAPVAPEITVKVTQEVSSGIDTFRRITAETDAFRYDVDLELDRTDENGHLLHLQIESKQTGARAESFGYPRPGHHHEGGVRLAAARAQTFGEIADSNGAKVPLTGAELSCLIGNVPQNRNLETSYPTLAPVP